MAITTFTPTGNTFGIGFSPTAANLVMNTVGAGQNTLFKIDNSSGQLCFVAFGATANAVASINHPTLGSSGSQNVVTVRSGQTEYINPGLGTISGPVYVGVISISGSGNIYIQPGI